MGAALALMGGILAAWWLEVPAGWLAAAGCLAVGTAAGLVVWRPASRLTAAALLGLVAVLGAARYWLATTPLDPAHVARFATDQRALVRLAGSLVTEPHVRGAERSKDPFQRDLGPSTNFYLQAESLVHGGVRRRASGLVLVVVYEAVERLHAGDQVEVVGRLTRPAPVSNPGQRLRPGSSLAAILSTDHAEAVTHAEGGLPRVGRGTLALLRRHMASTIQSHLDRRSAGTLMALIIGDRGRIESDLKRAFVVTGTAHLLAISGLHVGLVAAVFWGLLRAVRVPERPALVLVVLVAFVYAMLTGLHAPALRACVMIAVLALGGLVRRDPDHVNSLAVAAIVVLLVNPTDLFQAGFRLSFAATLGLLLFADPLNGALRAAGRRLFAGRRERRRIEAAARPGRPGWIGRRVVRVIRQALVVALVAWLVTLPLSAYYFRQVAWLCPLATLVAAPFLWTSLTMGLVMCVAGVFGLAGGVAPLVSASLHLLDRAVALCASIPGSGALAGWSPPVGVVVLCYVGCGVIALRGRLGLSARRLAAALVLVAAGVVWRACADPAPTAPELTVLDVGHGQCAVLRTPEGHTVLFDAGSLWRAGGAWRTVAQALFALRVNHIDLAILSHPDTDHYSALPGLMSAFRVDGVVVPRRFTTSTDPEARALLKRLREAGVPLRIARAGDVFDWFQPLRLTVFHPGADSEAFSDNDASLVVQAAYKGVRLLSTGDLQEAGIASLLCRGEALESEVLVAPHHGGYEANLDKLLLAVRPRVVVISGPLTARVQQALALYRRHTPQALVTGQCGAVTVQLVPGLHVRTWRSPGRG